MLQIWVRVDLGAMAVGVFYSLRQLGRMGFYGILAELRSHYAQKSVSAPDNMIERYPSYSFVQH